MHLALAAYSLNKTRGFSLQLYYWFSWQLEALVYTLFGAIISTTIQSICQSQPWSCMWFVLSVHLLSFKLPTGLTLNFIIFSSLIDLIYFIPRLNSHPIWVFILILTVHILLHIYHSHFDIHLVIESCGEPSIYTKYQCCVWFAFKSGVGVTIVKWKTTRDHPTPPHLY